MKSVFITILMFAIVLAAIHIGLFEAMSSSYAFIIAFTLLFTAIVFAFRILGNPFAKDEKNDKEKN